MTRSLIHFLARSEHPLARSVRAAKRGVQNFTVPTPRVVVRPLLLIFLGARFVFHFIVRVFICEPLFKAYCTSYGKGVRTGTYIHWIQGRGRLILGDAVHMDGKSSISFSARYVPEPELLIGSGTYVSHDCSFSVGRRIAIGSNCLLARGVWIFEMSGHPVDPADRLAGRHVPADKVRPVTIGDNVWIGSGCMILPGTTIGDGSVVSAGSVVRGDIPPNSLVSGNPAQVVATLGSRSGSQ
jgi:acetyltransferase-like isoleucine patch superfamily enzyme